MKTFKTTSNWIIYGRQEGKFTSIELKEGEVFGVEESPKGNAIIHKKMVNFLWKLQKDQVHQEYLIKILSSSTSLKKFVNIYTEVS